MNFYFIQGQSLEEAAEEASKIGGQDEFLDPFYKNAIQIFWHCGEPHAKVYREEIEFQPGPKIDFGKIKNGGYTRMMVFFDNGMTIYLAGFIDPTDAANVVCKTYGGTPGVDCYAKFASPFPIHDARATFTAWELEADGQTFLDSAHMSMWEEGM